MACVEAAIPVPNSRKKTDELFLYWLSEPSTQELLRKELAKISGIPYSELDDKTMLEVHTQVTAEHGNFLSPSVVTNVLRPGSPNVRTPSPPLLSHRSPKSPRGAVRSRSPKKTGKSPNGKQVRKKNGLHLSLDEADSGGDDAILHNTAVSSGSNNMVHTHLTTHNVPDVSNIEGADSEIAKKRDRRSRSHSPKPESLPTGPGINHIPKPGTNSSHIPRFYFPNGKPPPEDNVQEIFTELSKLFASFDDGEASFKQFPEIMKVSIVSIII